MHFFQVKQVIFFWFGFFYQYNSMKREMAANVLCKSQLNFKKFNRKSYSAFRSMHMIIRISTLAVACCIISIATKTAAQPDTIYMPNTFDLEEVEIVGQKNSALVTEMPGMISIYSIKESEPSPSRSIQDLLRYSSTIDSRQRGKGGIQTDLSIRGGSFDQTLVLLNGISLSDPQTGHLSLFLPVETDAIKRIEVLSGSAAKAHGTNAFSGAIHFITRPSDSNSIALNTSAGSYGYISTSLTVNLGKKKFRHLIHYHFGRSDGYTYNTDYAIHNAFYQGQMHYHRNILDVQIGFANRAFGANGFYSSALPEQFEHNRMGFASLSYKTKGILNISPKVYWRRHRDRFEYFREGSEWYRFENGICISNDLSQTSHDTIDWYSQHNHHINDVFGAQITMNISSKIGKTTLDWHVRNENIISNNIGYDRGTLIPVRGYANTFYNKTDNRQNFDINLGQTIAFGKIFLAGSILLNWNSYLPDEMNVFPGLDLKYEILKSLHFIASYNNTLGLPTFTDLTYEDPDNEGNLELLPYSKNSIEGGIRFVLAKHISTVNLYSEQGNNVIDWVWFPDISRFRPVNVDHYMSRGIEISSKHDFSDIYRRYFPIQNFSVHYSFIDMKKEIPEEVTKYFHVRHKLSAVIHHKVINHLIAAWNISYIDRTGSYLDYSFEDSTYNAIDFKPYWLFDLRLSYYWKDLTLYAEATNLFNKKYIDIGSIYQPGRWLSLGVKYRFAQF